MAVWSLIKRAERNQFRVLEDSDFWTPTFCRAFFDWCDTQAFEEPEGRLVRGELAILLAKKTDDRHAIAKAHGVKASAYRMLSLFEHSEAEFARAFALADSCPCCLGDLLRRQGILRIHQRRFSDSLPLFDRAIANYRKSNSRDGVGRVLVSRGAALYKLDRIDEALDDEHQALSLLSPLSPLIYHLSVLTNITACLVTGTEKHFAHAEVFCTEFRQYLEGLDGFTVVRVRLSWAHGIILVRLGERKRGLQMLRRARKALIHGRHDSEVIAITADISQIYCDTGKYHLIIELVNEVLSTLGDVSGTRSVLTKILRMAERERIETRKLIIALREAVSASIPSLFAPPVEALRTP